MLLCPVLENIKVPLLSWPFYFRDVVSNKAHCSLKYSHSPSYIFLVCQRFIKRFDIFDVYTNIGNMRTTFVWQNKIDTDIVKLQKWKEQLHISLVSMHSMSL